MLAADLAARHARDLLACRSLPDHHAAQTQNVTQHAARLLGLLLLGPGRRRVGRRLGLLRGETRLRRLHELLRALQFLAGE